MFDFQKMLRSRDVFCTLSCLFVRLGLRLLCALWLFIILPFHPVGFREFKQTSTATTNEYNGCVSEGYNSVHFIAVLYKTTSFFSNFDAVSHILFGSF